jgi:hypothetical protein
LRDMMPRLSASSVFYHFIDARRRLPDAVDDFRAWLRGFGDEYNDLMTSLSEVDPYFETLTELKERLAAVFISHCPLKP